ncbi:hypothetical protein LguiA_005098 [Lonicera macranthoides]
MGKNESVLFASHHYSSSGIIQNIRKAKYGSSSYLKINESKQYVAKENIVRTCHGPISVIAYGDQDKTSLLTYPDLALNCK